MLSSEELSENHAFSYSRLSTFKEKDSKSHCTLFFEDIMSPITIVQITKKILIVIGKVIIITSLVLKLTLRYLLL